MKISPTYIISGASLHPSCNGQGRGRAVWLTRHMPAGMASAKAMLHQAGLYLVNLPGSHPYAPLYDAYGKCHARTGKRFRLYDAVSALMTKFRVREERQHGE
ncbi:hypothetical protein C7431_11184 [Pantoea allii]|uniref:Uncharacterized protein n=1 Tax=Pantoea allii TaxID=574096 RepID=A0A2V2B541_9GAMM|nr:hypothetical protein [Pantoea allii]PWK94347.1 hypothetical protein C7431_11184 [Pantoea allii]